MATLGTLTVDLVARTGSFVQGLDKGSRESEKFRRKVKRNLEQVGRQMKTLAAVGVAGLVGSFGAVVAASGRQEEAIKQLETRLKSTGGVAGLTSRELQNFASEMQKVTRFGDEAVIEMQSMLLTFTSIREEVFQRTTPVILDLATAMDMDLKSATLQLGKALNDPVKNLSALSRAGIQFSKDQQETIKTLAETGRLAEAQSLILDELETQFGGSAAAAADTFRGRLDQVKNAFGDLLENPSGLNANKDALEDLRDFLQDPATIQAAERLTGALISGFKSVAEAIRETVGLAQFLGEEAARIVAGAASDDLVRLNEELAKMQELLDSSAFSPNRVRLFGTGGVVEYWSDEELRTEMARVREAIAREQARLANQLGYSPTPLPAPAAATTNGGLPPAAATPSTAAPPPMITTPAPPPMITTPAVLAPDIAMPRVAPPSMGSYGGDIDVMDDMYTEQPSFQEMEEAFRDHKTNMVDIEREGNEALAALNQIAFAGMTRALGNFVDESSVLYQAAFAVEKGAAIARAIVAIQTAIAQASASAPFPANLGAMATVAANTAGLIGTIQSTVMGQAHDGMMSIPKTGSYILEQGERVMPAETTAKLDRTLDEVRGGAGGVRIINTIDPSFVDDYMASPAGERVILNALKRNQRTVRQLAV